MVLSLWYFKAVQMPYILFTGLEDFKVRGANAAPYFTVAHYTDLQQSKGLVLIRGDVVLTSRTTDDEARNLLKNAHEFYLDDRKFRFVTAFNREQDHFDFRALLREMGLPSP
eukprot:TRINITY_DN3787_c1_g1_i1.p2 TRINITY_DN3787_c1_g1~~TRINITY_DN3787_c1_g1_i1.p2  ORF type:complete len:112 (+),score=23.29 TRINITY_DN3787_c1_g1_i1:365-700(+)